MRHQTFVCDKCGAATTIYADPSESTREFEEDLPQSMACTRDECEGMMWP